MAKNDVIVAGEPAFGYPGDTSFIVASGTTASINVGEFVLSLAGGSQGLGAVQTAAAWTNSSSLPAVGTNYVLGVATSASNETASVAGTVKVQKFVTGMSYLVNPDVAATWNTQAKYDALVGSRVLLKSAGSGGAQTLLAADSANNGFVVLPMDITTNPGKVLVTLRNGLNYLT